MSGKLVACIAAWLLVLAASSDALDIVSRATWGAAPPKFENPINGAVSHVIVHHTVTPSCSGSNCYSRLRQIQQDHFAKQYGDIGYNFLVGQDGSVYEGQGFGRRGAHAAPANSKSIGVSFLGNFQTSTPSQASINALSDLIALALQRESLRSNYKLVGHRSVKATACPGENLYKKISELPNFSKTF